MSGFDLLLWSGIVIFVSGSIMIGVGIKIDKYFLLTVIGFLLIAGILVTDLVLTENYKKVRIEKECIAGVKIKKNNYLLEKYTGGRDFREYYIEVKNGEDFEYMGKKFNKRSRFYRVNKEVYEKAKENIGQMYKLFIENIE